VKYVRLYGFEHKRTEGQFEAAWKELQNGLPKDTDGNFLLGVSGQTLLLDGQPLETGQAERSFATLLNAAGLASIHFSNTVTESEFTQLVRAFANSGAKAQEVIKQIKATFGEHQKSSIRINEVKYVAADPATGEISMAAQLAAQNLGPEFKQWLNDPGKLLQLIAAAEGAKRIEDEGGSASGETGTSTSSNVPAQVLPLEEQEVIQAIRLLTKFGEAGQDPTTQGASLQIELDKVDSNTKVNLQQLLASLATAVPDQKTDTPVLMKAAENMAIRFALERFNKGDVKVDAVHEMLGEMSERMESLRKILRVQEEKMSKAGILVESHSDLLDRMFWAEVPDEEKKKILLSDDAQSVPPRNLRQFVESLVERDEDDTAIAVLRNYAQQLGTKQSEPRRKVATGLSQLADLYASLGADLLGGAIARLGEALSNERDPEMQSLLSASFVRLSTEAGNRRHYDALNEVCSAMEKLAKDSAPLANEMRPRVGLENRLPEYIEEAIKLHETPRDLIAVLRRTSEASAEHLADRFFRCMRRDECDRMVEIARQLGRPAMQHLREMLQSGQPRQATSVIGLMSRLDVPALLELLPVRLRDWNRFYHDVSVRQIAYGAAHDRGRTLLELVEFIDPLVLPQAMDEIGMSGDRTVVPPLIVMAEAGEASGRPPLLQLKSIESLGRLRDQESVPVLRNLLEAKKMWKWVQHRELRIAAAQALTKIDPRYAPQIMAESGLEPGDMAIAPLDSAPSSPWVRQRRYERIALRKTMNAALTSSWGKSSLAVRELSLGGGMGTKDDNLRLGAEAEIDISNGVRHIKAQVLLRRTRLNEIGFEIVSIDLESRYRLRRTLMETVDQVAAGKTENWSGDRKP
jgi:hypothetical protein